MAAVSTPAQAANCTVNVYEINTAKGGTHVYVSSSGYQRVYHDPKAHGVKVTGPNSHVLKPNEVNGRRAVYLRGGGLGWMYSPLLEYLSCS